MQMGFHCDAEAAASVLVRGEGAAQQSLLGLRAVKSVRSAPQK